MIRLIIVDDHTVVRQGIRFLFEQEPDFDVVGESATGAAVTPMVEALRPDVVLLDLFLPDVDGLTVLRRIRAAHPATAVVMLTSSPEDTDLVAALRQGAASYLQKSADAAEVLSTVRAAAHGHSELPVGVASRLISAIRAETAAAVSDPLNRLTPRERDVLNALAGGRSNREIGRALHISEETVKTHVSSVLAKLGVADRTQAAIYALRHGITGEPGDELPSAR